MALAYISYLLEYPELVEKLMSHRYLLRGPMPDRERRPRSKREEIESA